MSYHGVKPPKRVGPEATFGQFAAGEVQDMPIERFTSDGTVGPYTLSVGPRSAQWSESSKEDNIDVWVGQVYVPSDQYQVDGLDLTFNEGNAPENGRTILVKYRNQDIAVDTVAERSVGATELADDAVALSDLADDTNGAFLGFDADGKATAVTDFAESLTNRYNLTMNSFKIARNNGLTMQNMVDGIADEYVDVSGVDVRGPWQGINFDGTNDYLARGADLTGNADTKVGTVSFWVKFNADGGTQRIWQNTSGYCSFYRTTNNAVIFAVSNSSGTVLMDVRTSALTAASGWHHVMASWDLSITTAHVYVDGVSDYAEITAPTDDTIDWTRANSWVGTQDAFSNKLNADIFDLYMNFAEYIDLSVEANRRKFIDADGYPVDLGTDGSLPTGTSPIVFLTGNLPGFITNTGTGGGFTENGTLNYGDTLTSSISSVSETFYPFSNYFSNQPSVSVIQTENSTTTAGTTLTISNANLGYASADRKIVIGINGGDTAAALSSVTVDGDSANEIIITEFSDNQVSGFYYIDNNELTNPNVTQGDVVLTWTSSQSTGSGLGVWIVYGAEAGTASDSDGGTGAGDPIELSLSLESGGAGIGIAHVQGFPTITWTGLTEEFEENVQGGADHSGASAENFTGAISIGDTATNSTASVVGWNPTNSNMTLVSDTFTANDADPSTGHIIVAHEFVDPGSLNSDFTAEVSRDDGTTWSTATLATEATNALSYNDSTEAFIGDPVSITASDWNVNAAYTPANDDITSSATADISGITTKPIEFENFDFSITLTTVSHGLNVALFDANASNQIDTSAASQMAINDPVNYYMYFTSTTPVTRFGYGSPARDGYPFVATDAEITREDDNTGSWGKTITWKRRNGVMSMWWDGIMQHQWIYPFTGDLLFYLDNSAAATAISVSNISWQEINLTSHSTNIVAGQADLSGQPSGSSMKYRLKTLNNVEQRIHAASLQWR